MLSRWGEVMHTGPNRPELVWPEGRRRIPLVVARQHNITEQTFFRWRSKFGGMTVSDAHKLKALEVENLRLKKMVAEQMLAIEGLKEIATKKW